MNLREKPFYLSEEDIDWVESTLAHMTTDEKIGQLFFPINFIQEEEPLRQFIETFQPAGALNRPGNAKVLQKIHGVMQEASKIPMLIAANIESGGNGIATEGTTFGNPLQVAATGNASYAHQLGVIAGTEGKAVGVNYAFAPVIDIDYNTLNPITNTRTFGSNPERVYEMASAYIDGLTEAGKDMIYSIKHFPGDGVDDRDQHLHVTYNTFSVEKWEETYGKNYRRLIDKGAPTVMVGHIGLPEYVKEINPNASIKEILAPASLSKELVSGLLRERMNFNGVIITDSTSMMGFCTYMSRELAVPTAIANGCDLFLFNFSLAEDFQFMKKGIENGILTMERVNEAVTRTLALKASMGLHKKQEQGLLIPDEKNLCVVGCSEFKEKAKECANRAVTLVKDENHVLPLTVDRHKRLFVSIMGDREDFYGNKKVGSRFVEAMQKEGFLIDLFDDSVKIPDPNETTRDFLDRYDAAIYVLNEGTSSNQTTVRLKWNLPLANDAPWFVNDIPVIGISFANPYHLRDMPELKTYINAYTTNEYTVEAVVEKLLGRSPYTGVNPVDTTCGCYELRMKEQKTENI